MKQKKSPHTKSQIHERVKLAFFLIASATVFYLLWLILTPYLMVLATAAVVAVALSPLHQTLTSWLNNHERWCALLLVLMTLAVILALVISGVVFVSDDIATLLDGGFSGDRWQDLIRENRLVQILPRQLVVFLSSLDATNWLRNLAETLSDNFRELASGALRLVFKTALFFMALYYFLAERRTLKRELLSLSPLSDRFDENMIARVAQTVRAVVVGNVIVGFIQGILAAIGFFIFSMPSAVILGLLTMLAAQIPMVGTGIVIFPSAIYLALSGHLLPAIGLALWGLLLVGTIDNAIKPQIVGSQTKMHSFLILLAMLGGLQIFGPIGFILGPAVLAICLSLLSLYEAGVLEGGVKL